MSKAPLLLENSWKKVLHAEWDKPYVEKLSHFLIQERAVGAVYPPQNQVFSAFTYTPYDKVQVVIIGQDPYHGPEQAHGLSFSVLPGVPQPPSLKNIFKELQADLGISPPSHGSLLSWAAQGVLMLNAVLTVRAHEPRSHQGQGWEIFTDRVVAALDAREDPVIFVLWGKDAKLKGASVKNPRHYILEAPHPSPFSAHSGFFGSRPFSKINQLLKEQGKAPIDWKIV